MRAADLALILAFTAGGILLSIIVNYIVVQAALRPLTDLREQIENIRLGQRGSKLLQIRNPDANIHVLTEGIGELLNELQAQNARLRMLTKRSIYAQEEERLRVARWLHDDTGQALSTLILRLERLEQTLPAEQREQLSSATELASHTLHELRGLIAGLRPSILDDLGLGPAIRWYARQQLESAGILVEIDIPHESITIAPDVSIAFFRIAQEAITNVVRHARAQRVTICLQEQNGKLCLRIQDDGVGFLPSAGEFEHAARRRWGLLGIRERAAMIGAEIRVESETDEGTRIEVSVALDAGESRDG